MSAFPQEVESAHTFPVDRLAVGPQVQSVLEVDTKGFIITDQYDFFSVDEDGLDYLVYLVLYFSPPSTPCSWTR